MGCSVFCALLRGRPGLQAQRRRWSIHGATELLLQGFRRCLPLLLRVHKPGHGHPYVTRTVPLPEEHYPRTVLSEKRMPGRHITLPRVPGQHPRQVVQGRILGRRHRFCLVLADVVSAHQHPPVQPQLHTVRTLRRPGVLLDEDIPLCSHSRRLPVFQSPQATHVRYGVRDSLRRFRCGVRTTEGPPGNYHAVSFRPRIPCFTFMLRYSLDWRCTSGSRDHRPPNECGPP